MDKTIDFSSLKSEITADKVIDLARKHNDSETLNETLRRKGDIYERRNNYVSTEIWSDASAPLGRKTIGEYDYIGNEVDILTSCSNISSLGIPDEPKMLTR